jgi:DNA-binding CsgD family transcriptional regulator
MFSLMVSLLGMAGASLGLVVLCLGPGRLGAAQRAWRAGAILALLLLELGMVIGHPLAGAAGEAVWFDRIGTWLLALASPAIALSLRGPGGSGRAGRLIGAAWLVLGAVALGATLAGLKPLLRVWLWVGIAAALAAALVVRLRHPCTTADRLWGRLFLVLLAGLPLLLVGQLSLALPALAAVRAGFAGLDLAWFAITLSASLAWDCLPGRLRTPAGKTNTSSHDQSETGLLPGLSPREAEIARLLKRGLAYKEIAAALDISYKTVDHHIQALYRKTGVSNRHALVERLFAPPGNIPDTHG